MRVWFAIIIAPVLALVDQSVAFALVGWSCAHQTTVPIHAAHAAFLVATLAAVYCARDAWRDTARNEEHSDIMRAQRHFLARLGIAIAALSALAVAALWIPAWMISPCIA